MCVLEDFAVFEEEMNENRYINVRRCKGRHCIKLSCHEDSILGNMVLLFIERDFRHGLYSNLMLEVKDGVLEVCPSPEFSNVLSDQREF